MDDLHLLADVAAAVAWRATKTGDPLRVAKREECERVMRARKMVVGGDMGFKAAQVEHELFYAAESELVYRMHDGDEMRMFFVINLVLSEIYENPLPFQIGQELDEGPVPVDDWASTSRIPAVREGVRSRVWEMLRLDMGGLREVAKEATMFIETHLFKDAKSKKDFCNRLTLERRVHQIIITHPEDFKRLRGQPPTTPTTRRIKWEWEKKPTAPGGGGGDDVCCLGKAC